MTLKLRSLSIFINFLLISIVLVNCGCTKAPLEREEERLIEEAVNAGKDFLNGSVIGFSQQEVDAAIMESFKKKFKMLKSTLSSIELDKSITRYKTWKSYLETGDSVMKYFTLVVLNAKRRKKLDKLEFSKGGRTYPILANSPHIDKEVAIRYVISYLKLLEYFKKQAELKDPRAKR